MKDVLQCALVLLLLLAAGPSPGRASERLPSSSGEWCRAWKYTAVGTGLLPSPVRSFRCPERYDRADATFCCGSCLAPYCCAWEAERLDLDRCAVATKGGMAAPRRGEQIFLDFVWVCFGVVLFSILCCIAHIIYHQFGDCRRTSREESQRIPMENLRAGTQVNHDLNANNPSLPINAAWAGLHQYPTCWNPNLPRP